MEYNRKIEEWIAGNGGYYYYLTPRFMGLFDQCEVIFIERNSVEVVFEDYVILCMIIRNRSVYLQSYIRRDSRVKKPIQDKLCHEYNNYFSLSEDYFKITQYNMYALLEYVNGVKKKIHIGFDRYLQLLEKNIKSAPSGYLKIEINNAFSLEELKELIDAYNRLYSLFFYVCENGVEEIGKENIEQVLCKNNMILESIHIGSKGDLISVGVELIVDLVKAFVKSVFESDRVEAAQRKEELLRRAEMEEFIETRQHIFTLIELLDSYLDKRERGCHHGVVSYMEFEINIIVEKIEQLQGSRHIDMTI